MDFSVIKSKELKQAMSESRKFEAMKKNEQTAFLTRIAALPEKGQANLCEFFLKENIKEKKAINKREQKFLAGVMDFLQDLTDLKDRFGKKVLHEKERIDREKEQLDGDALLNQINNS